MKPTITNLQDAFAISRDVYKDSDLEAQEIVDMFHNRQYTQAEIDVLTERGQPIETFNVIKTFSNAIAGYFDTVVNNISVTPRYTSNPTAANVLNDTVQYVLDENEFETEATKVELDGLLTGKMCVYYDIVDTKLTDEFGRKVKEIKVEHVPSAEVRIDPMSRKDDRSDSRFTSRWRWVDEEEFNDKWPNVGTVNHKGRGIHKAETYSTEGTEDVTTEFENRYGIRLRGKFEEWNNYLVVHTVMRDGDTLWSCIWHNDIMLEKKKIPYKDMLNPYRVILMSSSDKAEHYGPFREIVETQKAINQALIQIQLLINTKKAFVETDAVGNISEFKEQFNKVNEVVVVDDLQGIKVEDLSKDIMAQYSIIDKGLERIKTVLGVNDSFLGQTFASDSGRKVNLQQNSSKSQLSVVVKRVQFLYKMVGEDIVGFIKQYYIASQVLKIADKVNGDRYLELNKPIQMPNGQRDQQGGMVTNPVFDEEIDPGTGEPMEDEYGNILMTPVSDPDSTLKFLNVDIKVEAVPYNNAAEQNQLLFETFINGPLGQSVLQTNPAGYYKVAGMQISEFGTKNSADIAQVLYETGQLVSGGQMDPSLAQAGGDAKAVMGGALGGSNGGGPKSQQLQLPTGGK